MGIIWMQLSNWYNRKECVAVFIELYKNTVTVSCVGSDFLSDWRLYRAIEPAEVVTILECPVI